MSQYRKLSARVEEETRKSELFALDLAGLLGVSVAQYNSRDDNAVAGALQSVKEELSGHFEMLVETRFGGSVLKDTYVEGFSDVDALIVFQESAIARLSPIDIHARAASCLRARFGTSIVKEGKFALTLHLSELELQLLPAIVQNEVLKIGRSDSQRWSIIQPQIFVSQLVQANRAMNGRLVPTVKVAKVIIAQLPKPLQLQGYHIEVLAISIFSGYNGRKELKDMLRFFFDRLSPEIMILREDVSGQSKYLDAYLGHLQSSRRRSCADAMDRISRRMHSANAAWSIESWQDLLGKSRL